MIKIIISLLLYISSTYAIEFNKFLEIALDNNVNIKAEQLYIKQLKEEKEISTRVQNPNLEIGVSQYSQNGLGSQNGYSIVLNQSIQIPKVTESKKDLANMKINSINQKLIDIKAIFIRDTSLLYVDYSQVSKQLALSKKLKDIMDDRYHILSQKYKNGAIPLKEFIQSNIDLNRVKSDILSLQIKQDEAYFRLLEIAGITNTINIDTRYKFRINDCQNGYTNSKINYLNSKKSIEQSKRELLNNSIEEIEVIAQYEQEPDQDIYNIAFSIPLTVFNSKDEEKAISRLKTKKINTLIESEQSKLSIKDEYLQKEIINLNILKNVIMRMIEEQYKLKDILDDSYKVSKLAILDRLNISNEIIKLEKELEQINGVLNRNTIKLNYLRGNFNEY